MPNSGQIQTSNQLGCTLRKPLHDIRKKAIDWNPKESSNLGFSSNKPTHYLQTTATPGHQFSCRILGLFVLR